MVVFTLPKMLAIASILSMALAGPVARTQKRDNTMYIHFKEDDEYAGCGVTDVCAEAATAVQANNFFGCSGEAQNGGNGLDEGRIGGPCDSTVFQDRHITFSCGGSAYTCTVNGQYMLDYYTADQSVSGGPCNANSEYGGFMCFEDDFTVGKSVCTGY